MYKRSLGTRIWIIADKYNIEQVQVSNIIKAYVSFCREKLLEGYVVSFSDLVVLVPDNLISKYRMTLAYQCKQVSKICGKSYHTVFSIINEYLSFLREDVVERGNSVDIRGIVSIHPILRDDVIVKVHSSISCSIKRDLSERNGYVTHVRAHTHKLLKHSIKLSCAEGLEVRVN